MKRRSPLILSVLVAAAAGGLAWAGAQKTPPPAEEAPVETAETPEPEAEEEEGAAETDPVEATEPTAPARVDGDFSVMPDGSAIPPLPEKAPKRVKLGVAIFRYAGAQGTAKDERSKEEALKLAQAAITGSGDDFTKLAGQGDKGSRSNVGWIPRGTLEPYVEYEVFTLDKGQVRPEPLDTPRGFWVVKRIR